MVATIKKVNWGSCNLPITRKTHFETVYCATLYYLARNWRISLFYSNAGSLSPAWNLYKSRCQKSDVLVTVKKTQLTFIKSVLTHASPRCRYI